MLEIELLQLVITIWLRSKLSYQHKVILLFNNCGWRRWIFVVTYRESGYGIGK